MRALLRQYTNYAYIVATRNERVAYCECRGTRRAAPIQWRLA